MKKGISIWSFPAGTLKESFLLAKDAGFEGVEVALDEGTGEITLESGEKDLLEIKKQADEIGIELYSVATGLYWSYFLNDEDETVRQKAQDIVKKQLEVAAVLGCESILVIPGCVNAEFAAPGKVYDYLTCYERSLESVMKVKSYAEQYKVQIALENVWNKFLLSPMEMRDFIDKVGSDYVGSYLDIGNVLANGFPEHWIRALGSRIKKVHFKDYRMEAGGLHGFVDLLAGDVNYPAVMEELKKIGYDGWVSAEMIPNYKYYTETIIYNTSNAMDRIMGRR
ncbi:MAG: sugar phosphate isomerase/epimerase [Ruminococcaceae bacterium]|nr:sugar phosphate isomerase/epimerase [Oscillospiraceae bacterium]